MLSDTPGQAAVQGQRAFVAAAQSSVTSLEPECAQGTNLKLQPWAHAHLELQCECC